MMQTSYKVVEIQDREIIISSKASKINVSTDMNAEKLVFKMPRYYNDLDLTSLDLVLYIKGVDVSDILAIRGYEVVDGYIVWEFVPQGAMLLKSGYIDAQVTGVQIVNNALEVKWQTKVKENAFYINNTLIDVVETVVKPLPTELEQYRAEIVRLIESVNLDDVVMDITADTENVLVLHRGNGTHSNVALNVRGGITLDEVNQVVGTHNASLESHQDIRGKIEENANKIGSLPTLTTTDKTSTVGAINELDNEIGILSDNKIDKLTKRYASGNPNEILDGSFFLYSADNPIPNRYFYYQQYFYNEISLLTARVQFATLYDTDKIRTFIRRFNGTSWIVTELATADKTEISFPFNSGVVTKNGINTVSKINNIVYVNVSFGKSDNTDFTTDAFTIGTLPVGYRPKTNKIIPIFRHSGEWGVTGVSYAYLNSAGTLSINVAGIPYKVGNVDFSFIVD